MNAARIQVTVGVAVGNLIDVGEVLLAASIRDRLKFHDLADTRRPPAPDAVDNPPEDGHDEYRPQDPHPVRVERGIVQAVGEITGHVLPFRGLA